MLRSRYLKLYFNPRTPCGVRRLKSSGVPLPKLFQSTHPLRGATERRRQQHHDPRYFNPRTPCGVRRAGNKCCCARRYFNPRTPCGVRRYPAWAVQLPCPAFQSTHPLRGATYLAAEAAGRDPDFNPRTPCGVRPVYYAQGDNAPEFQSTHPLRGATRVGEI